MAIGGSTSSITEYGIELNWSINTLDSLGNTVNPQTLIQRTTGSAAPSTANWTTVVTSRLGQTSYTDVLGSAAIRRWYRIQHVLIGYQASTWLGTVDAMATELGDV